MKIEIAKNLMGSPAHIIINGTPLNGWIGSVNEEEETIGLVLVHSGKGGHYVTSAENVNQGHAPEEITD